MTARFPPLQLVVRKLREDGLAWVKQRMHDELRMPRTAVGQAVFRGVRALGRGIAGSRQPARLGSTRETLYAFYDLGVAPVTFDFLWFLVGAELARQRSGQASIHVVIVPGPHRGLRKESAELDRFVDAAARRARIRNVLLPACTLLSSVAGVTLAASRAEAEEIVGRAGGALFPAGYETALPSYPGPQQVLRVAREEGRSVGALRATAEDLRSVDAWLASHRCDGQVVAITLRGYDYTPERNSNIRAWADFARRLDARFSPVIVPDTAQTFAGVPHEFEGLPIFTEATVAVGLRMALYERAYINLGVNNGPMGLCWLNERTRYITFKMLSDAAAQTTRKHMEFLGFGIGQSLPFATPSQRWVWEEDSLDVIETAFREMVSRPDRDAIGAAPQSPPHFPGASTAA